VLDVLFTSSVSDGEKVQKLKKKLRFLTLSPFFFFFLI